MLSRSLCYSVLPCHNYRLSLLYKFLGNFDLFIGRFALQLLDSGYRPFCPDRHGGRWFKPFYWGMIDRLGAPWYTSLLSTSLLLVFQAVETAAGGINVAAVVIVTFGLNVCRQLQQVSLT